MNEQSTNDVAPDNNAHRFIVFLSIILVVVGQIFVYTTPVDQSVLFPSAIVISVLGFAIFVLSQVAHPPHFIEAALAQARLPKLAFWVFLSFVLSSLAVLTMKLFEQQGRTNFIPVLTFWLFAILCYVTTFLKDIPSINEVWERTKRHRYELLAIGLITLLAFVLRFYKLGEIPKVVNGDEGRLGIAALSTSAPPFANPFALWENFGALYLQAVNLFLYTLGISPFSLRLAAALGGTLAIPALYLLARQISGSRIALIAACLLAVSHTHIHFSRTIAVAYIQGTWLIPLELYFLISGLMKRSSWRAAVGGALLAVHYSVYLDSQIITSMILIYMVIAFIFMRDWFKPALRQVAVFWGGFGITLLPELAYIQAHPDIFMNRVSENGMFQSGWLSLEMANTGQNAFQILGARVIHAFLSLIYYPSVDFYGSTVPMLSLLSATLFLLGLAIALVRVKSPKILLLNGYFWAGTVSIGLFAIPPSADTYRMLIVLPSALLMAAIGFDHILQAFGLGWSQMPKVYVPVTALLISSLLVFNVWAYYFHFAGRCLYGTDEAATRFASFLGNYTRTVDKESQTYLLNDGTFTYGTHQSVDFLSNRHVITNVPEPVDTLQPKPDEIIIANPNRIQELRTWADSHPGGTLHYEYDCQQVILLAYQFP